MPTIRALFLLFTPAILLAGCSQEQPPAQAEMQQRLTAAEARATAAEKRAKAAEDQANLRNQEPAAGIFQPAPAKEIAQADPEFGQPMPLNDITPIEPAPALPAEAPQQ